jgi:hypothetical protein
MNFKTFAFTAALIGLGVGAQTYAGNLSTRDGMVYTNITKQRIDADGLYIEYTPPGGGMGVAKVKFSRLSKELQKRYDYDAGKAEEYEEQYALAVQGWREELQQRDKAKQDARDDLYARQVQSAQEQAARNERMIATGLQAEAAASAASAANSSYGASGISLMASAIPSTGQSQLSGTHVASVISPFMGNSVPGHAH